MKIILTGGGTAGHIWPTMAIAEVLKNNHRVHLLYVGSFSGPEKKIAIDNNIPFRRIFVGKWRNYISVMNYLDLLKTFFGLIQSFFLILFFRPQVIFAKGGYVTFPLIYWAKIFKIPLVTHESDVVMGKTNVYAAKFAKKICLGYPIKYYQNIPIKKAVYTGIPVRKEFFDKIPIENERPTLLITGGSQGSQKINQIIGNILDDLLIKYEVYHLCGKNSFKVLNKASYSAHYHLIDFSLDMANLMRNADLIISRAGATTLAEISALGKPAIIIPLASAHLDHQSANAKVYQENNAAVVLSEKNLTTSSILSIINRLMEDKNLRHLLGHHAQEFARPDSAGEIIDILFEVANAQRK